MAGSGGQTSGEDTEGQTTARLKQHWTWRVVAGPGWTSLWGGGLPPSDWDHVSGVYTSQDVFHLAKKHVSPILLVLPLSTLRQAATIPPYTLRCVCREVGYLSG